MKQETNDTIIAPLMTVDGTYFIALSSPEVINPNGGSNSLEKTINAKDGRFRKIDISYVCPPCLAKKVCTVCPHRQFEFPSWASEESLEISKELMGDNDEIFLRENLGVVVDMGNQCFPKAAVDMMFNKARVPILQAARHIFVTVDPCTDANEKSEFAIVSVVQHHIVVGIDAFPARTRPDYEVRLIQHIRTLLENDFLKTAYVVLDVEAGTGYEASSIQNLVCNAFPNRIIPYNTNKQTFGTRTDNESKVNAMKHFQSLLAANNIHFWEGLICTDPKGIGKTLLKFKDQALRYHKVSTIPKTLGVDPKIIVTGKDGHHEDDGIVTWNRAHYTELTFFSHPDYAMYRHY
jgi:hypothetical protein